MTNKFEKLIEYIINDDDQKARELFHSIVVEKSRDIYESIMDQEACDEEVSGNQVGDMVDEIGHEETVGEDEEFDLDDDSGIEDDGEFAGDEFGDDEFGGDEVGGSDEPAGDDAIMNIDAKLDELLSKFDEIMGGEEAGNDEFGDDEFGDDEFGDDEVGDDEAGSDEFGGDEVGGDEVGGSDELAEAFGKSGKSGSAASGKSGSAASGKSGKSGSAASGKSGKPFEGKKSTAELMREYVDRIGDIYGGQGDATEGDTVGAAGKKVAVNKKQGSVGPGADFGGSNKNIARGGSNEAPDGKPVPKPSNEYNKGEGKLPGAGKFQNAPGGDKKLKSTGEEYSKERGKDGSGVGAGKSIGPQNQKSVQKQNTGSRK